ncbi:glycosyltransferase family A protein [Salsipaludibacter albus]|uniref:glycosyltransferase family A protein n=1 Tax=Salsipaludibacter albus TaxID=2849650 RepID=UPI001EE48F6D|nr:glycosyltransferase family 2 protein [Salsipaludibacter albus]
MRVSRVVVVVPARDEEADLATCLRALCIAAEAVDVPTRIVVVDDGSRDDTRRVAASLLDPPHLVVEGPGLGVGAARRRGVAVACGDHPDRSGTWVASTDADTVVRADWLVRQVTHARSGVDAVAGLVRLRAGGPPGLGRAFATHYGQFAPGHPHPHLHAANLGIRFATLHAAGSWPLHDRGEEHALWARLPEDARVLADPELVVETSPRLVGRAPRGFARDLAGLARQLDTPGD